MFTGGLHTAESYDKALFKKHELKYIKQWKATHSINFLVMVLTWMFYVCINGSEEYVSHELVGCTLNLRNKGNIKMKLTINISNTLWVKLKVIVLVSPWPVFIWFKL